MRNEKSISYNDTQDRHSAAGAAAKSKKQLSGSESRLSVRLFIAFSDWGGRHKGKTVERNKESD
jgi:hypothetical protein